MYVQLTSGCAVSKLLQFQEGRVCELIQLQVVRRHEEHWHAVHCNLHRHTNKEYIWYVPLFHAHRWTLTDNTHSIIDDFQGLWFHMKPLVSTLIQRVGLKQDDKQRGPCSCGCLPWWQEGWCRPVTGQACDFKQTKLGCDSDKKEEKKLNVSATHARMLRGYML